MPLPIGHSLISASVYVAYKGSLDIKRDFKEMALFVFMGLLPDADFITVPFTGFGAHRGVTHSFVFAFAAASIIFAALKAADRGAPS
ncbi:MAG: metal-dependent hydrolase, partial [Deltaproteobacteria bacterium]